MEQTKNAKKNYWFKTLMSFLLVLLTMPLGHALMILMEHYLSPTALHYAGFLLGFVGLIMVVVGVFAKGDTRQTLWGLFGGLLFWTGWVEFLFQYYANRYGVLPEMENGEIVTKPEYLIMPATSGIWMMVMLLYIFCTRTGCDFINWLQKKFFAGRKSEIVARPMTRHTSIVTFMELNMMLWTLYLVLMFCYDKNFLGDHHPVTAIVGVVCFIGSIFMFRNQLKLSGWGANIRMAIATVIIFWTPVEILGRLNFFQEIWTEPLQYVPQMVTVLIAFIVVAVYLWVNVSKQRPKTPRAGE